MTKPIRWGILGAGRVARGFAEGLATLEDATLVSVASRTEATVREFARQFAVAQAYTSYAELVRDPNVDVIYVATPHHRHVEDCLLCLEHGKPVLCEKPFTINAQQARTVIDKARVQRLFCMEAMWMRFMPMIRKAEQLVRSGAIGEARMLTADFGVAMAYDARSRFFDPQQGGGALLDRGVYTISLAHMLFGTPDHVSGHAGLSPTGVDEHSAVVLGFPQGRMAVLSSSMTSSSPNEATIMGTHGRIRIHAPFYCPTTMTITRYSPISEWRSASGGLKQRLGSLARKNPVVRRAGVWLRDAIRRSHVRLHQPLAGNGYNYEAAEVMRCLRAGEIESPIMPLDQTLRIMETMDRVRQQWGLRYPGE